MPSLYFYFAASFKLLSWKLKEKLPRRHKPKYAKCTVLYFKVNQGYVTLGIKKISEFRDFYAHTQPTFLPCRKFKIITLKTVEVAEKKR